MWSPVSTNVRVKIVRHVGVREFRDRATGLLKEAEPIAVERHGKVIGFYIPVESKRGEEEELREARRERRGASEAAGKPAAQAGR